ncbi:MAG: rod shape-determining protein MreC [Gammaproteobacteria bacterium]|nr:rod shape-determining protein MreC [Gammaproteobacteria bacterium]
MSTTFRTTARRPLFPRGPGLGLRFFALAAAAAALLASDLAGSPWPSEMRRSLNWALQPLVWLSALPASLDALGEQFKGRERLIAENRALRARQLELGGRLLKFDALQAENQRLRALLASASTLKERVLIASVLRTSQDPYRQQIVIDKGQREGAYPGQALIDAWGVLGQVIEVNRNSATALLITDPEHGVPVEVNRTGLQTIALGRGDGQTLSLPYLPSNADVRVGDLLVTSGLGGRFLAGYPVGQVTAIRRPAGESFIEAIAEPAAHLNRGRQVLLVWSRRAGIAPAGAPPAAAPAHPSAHSAASPP